MQAQRTMKRRQTYHKLRRNSLQITGQLPIELPIVVRGLRSIKLNKYGFETLKKNFNNHNTHTRWFVPIPRQQVWAYDIVFAESYNDYDTEYIRAVSRRQAIKRIKEKYPFATYRLE